MLSEVLPEVLPEVTNKRGAERLCCSVIEPTTLRKCLRGIPRRLSQTLLG